MPFMVVDGAELYYEDSGSGIPVVMISGLASDNRFWHKAVKMLDPSFRAIAVDNRGSGSTRYSGPITIERMADDVSELITGLGIGSAHVIGWSMGSHIALSLAARYPEKVRSLCVVSSYSDKPARTVYMLTSVGTAYMKGELSAKTFAEIFNVFTRSDRWFAEKTAAGKEIRTAEMPKSGDLYAQLNAVSTYSPADDARRIAVPTMSVHGLDDIMTPPAYGDSLADLIPGCVKVRIAGEGHLVPPELYFEKYQEFLKSH